MWFYDIAFDILRPAVSSVVSDEELKQIIANIISYGARQIQPSPDIYALLQSAIPDDFSDEVSDKNLHRIAFELKQFGEAQFFSKNAKKDFCPDDEELRKIIKAAISKNELDGDSLKEFILKLGKKLRPSLNKIWTDWEAELPKELDYEIILPLLVNLQDRLVKLQDEKLLLSKEGAIAFFKINFMVAVKAGSDCQFIDPKDWLKNYRWSEKTLQKEVQLVMAYERDYLQALDYQPLVSEERFNAFLENFYHDSGQREELKKAAEAHKLQVEDAEKQLQEAKAAEDASQLHVRIAWLIFQIDLVQAELLRRGGYTEIIGILAKHKEALEGVPDEEISDEEISDEEVSDEEVSDAGVPDAGVPDAAKLEFILAELAKLKLPADLNQQLQMQEAKATEDASQSHVRVRIASLIFQINLIQAALEQLNGYTEIIGILKTDKEYLKDLDKYSDAVQLKQLEATLAKLAKLQLPADLNQQLKKVCKVPMVAEYNYKKRAPLNLDTSLDQKITDASKTLNQKKDELKTAKEEAEKTLTVRKDDLLERVSNFAPSIGYEIKREKLKAYAKTNDTKFIIAVERFLDASYAELEQKKPGVLKRFAALFWSPFQKECERYDKLMSEQVLLEGRIKQIRFDRYYTGTEKDKTSKVASCKKTLDKAQIEYNQLCAKKYAVQTKQAMEAADKRIYKDLGAAVEVSTAPVHTP